MAVMTAPGVPDAMQYVLLPMYVGFSNIMSCAVFRGVALGVYHDKDAALALAALDTEPRVFETDTTVQGGGGGQMTMTSDSAICGSGSMVLGTALEEMMLEESRGSGFV